ncbi:DUF996 domain-containing protein [Vulcanisaeta distributa]|uniref:DUF996 domain-containing protein n=1 Tax=Vulcanisaeta distributa TaxID=164451 RepID=UPI001FB50E73|nr:DUF996 domain-containing protein [Vulcanisaeta distributa]
MSKQEEVRSAGTLGFIGGILTFIPYADVVGFILVLIALHQLSKAYNNNEIWRNAIVAVIISIVGAVIAIFSFIGVIAFLSSINAGTYASVGTIIAWVLGLYAIAVISGYFWRNAYAALASSSNVSEFASASRWYWWGSLLTIVIVGAILLIVADIYAILGYYRLSR